MPTTSLPASWIDLTMSSGAVSGSRFQGAGWS